MATKTTLSKPEYFMPHQAGVDTSDTKARRAWLAAKVAELTAQGYDCKVVDKGSYEHVSARKPVQVEGRLQLRGTCQACGSTVACTDGRTAKHGYKVIDRGMGGYFAGTCHGADRLPSEKSVEYATVVRADLVAMADYNEKLIPEAEADAKAAVRPAVREPVRRTNHSTGRRYVVDTTPEREEAAKLWDAYYLLTNRPAELRHTVRSCRAHVTHMDAVVFPRLGKNLYEVVVA